MHTPRRDERPDLAPVTSRPSSWPTWACAAAVLAGSLVRFGYDLGGEPHFMDESAYIAQSSYADLFLNRKFDDPAWLGFAALDVPPLVKYQIGLALRAGGYPRPALTAAAAWYHDQSFRPESPEALVVARVPSVIAGALGCTAVFALGAMARGRWAGAIAAVLLAVNPLYRMLARRAMCDATVEALTLTTVLLAVWGWRRSLAGGQRPLSWLGAAELTGVIGGLAVLAKLNGGLGLMTVAALAGLAAALVPAGLPCRRAAAVAGACLVSWGLAFVTFVLLNPFVMAHPRGPQPPDLAALAAQGIWGRCAAAIEHRRAFTHQMQEWFRDAALTAPRDKLTAVAVRGFGRYGLPGALRPRPGLHYERAADRWAWAWGAWVLAGAGCMAWRGRGQLRAGEPPVGWAVLLAVTVSFATIAALIPMNWDRYFLPIQSGSALLAGCAAAAAGGALGRVVSRAGLGRRPGAWVAAAGGLIVLLISAPLSGALGGGPREVFLSELGWASERNGWGPVERGASNGERAPDDGDEIALRGRRYPDGLGAHAGSEIRVALGGAYSAFYSDIGVDDEADRFGSVRFHVWADGRELYRSGLLTRDSPVERVAVDVSGCRELRLVIDDGGDGNHADHADWAGARLARNGRGGRLVPAAGDPRSAPPSPRR